MQSNKTIITALALIAIAAITLSAGIRSLAAPPVIHTRTAAVRPLVVGGQFFSH